MSGVEGNPHFDHLFKIGVLYSRSRDKSISREARGEARREILRYRDEGLVSQRYPKKEETMPKKRSEMTQEVETFSGQGILFAVIDDREQMPSGKVSTVDIISEAIESALDAGYETSDEIARYLTTSAFQHVKDRRVRFNSILKAGDAVGAQITRKLYNAYNELAQMADESEDPKEKASLKEEARGFAEAIQVVISPFSSEDPTDPRLVNWDEVDRMTESFEKEQRLVRKERNGRPQ